MKVTGLIIGLIMVCYPLFSQQDPSFASVPNLEITEISLADQNGNMTIEANEACNLIFILKNSGGRSANSVKIKLSHITSDNFYLNYKSSRSLLVVKANSSREVSIPIIAGNRVPKGSVEFQIEVIEPNGFDAYPAKIELNTAQGNLFQQTSPGQSGVGVQDLTDTSTLIIKGFNFADHNENDFLEAYETSYFQFRLYNLGDDDVMDIQVHIEQIDDKKAEISYSRTLDLGYYPSYYMQDITIPIEGNKNLADGMAEFIVYLSEENGLESNHQAIKIRTRKYEKPDLKIIKAEFSSKDGKDIRQNEPISLNLEIKNNGEGTAYMVETELKLLYDDVKLLDDKPRIRFEEIQGGATQEISYQLMVNRSYFLPQLPVILELSEDLSDFFIDTMFMTAVHLQEEEKDAIADQVPIRSDEQTDTEQEVTERIVQQVTLPDLAMHSLEFIDDDKNNVINVGESCFIKLRLKNSGRGNANDVSVKISQLNKSITGLNFPEEINLGIIEPDQDEEVSIPIRSLESLPTNMAEFRIDVLESRGLDAAPLLIEVKTQKLLEPNLSITYSDFQDESGQLRRNYPIELMISVNNSGPGTASDLKVKFELPTMTCVLLGDKDMYVLDQLASGETKNFSLLFTATRRHTDDQIPVKVEISESRRTYGIDTILVGDLNAETQVIRKHQVQPRIIETQAENPVIEARGGGDPLKGLGYEEALNEMQIGRYFALIIGIDDYQGKWHPLKNAVRDAQSVEELLKSKYKFDHSRALYNNLATRENIIRELEWLVRNVTPEDNILIFFSGHGEFKPELNRGYWIPVEAQTSSTFDYISNSVIQDFLSSIDSKHTLLISDACFSGDIFRGETISIPFERSERYYRNVHLKPSRQAITSGGMEPVMDGGRDGHSVFTYYLLKSLDTNQNMFFDASQLYNDLKIPVVNNSNQSPEFQHLKNTGDEGGQFIFIQK